MVGRCALVCLLSAGCVPASDDIAIEQVAPSSGVNTAVVPIRIEGTGFALPVVSNVDDGITRIETISAAVGGEALIDVIWRSDQLLEGSVRPGLDPGFYNVTVQLGARTAMLPEGYLVTSDMVMPPSPLCDPGDLDLRACFTFEGDTLDGSSYGNHAQSSPPAIFVADRNGGQALSTTTGATSNAGTTTLNVTTVTIKMWIKANTLPATGTRMGLLDSGGRYRMFLQPEGAVRCAVTSGSMFEQTTPPGLISVGTWHRVACTYDGTTLRVFVDGQERASAPIVGTIPSTTTGFFIGQNNPGGENFDGAIDDLQIWGSIVAP